MFVNAALVHDDARGVAWAEHGSPDELPSIHQRKEHLATAGRLPAYRVPASRSTGMSW